MDASVRRVEIVEHRRPRNHPPQGCGLCRCGIAVGELRGIRRAGHGVGRHCRPDELPLELGGQRRDLARGLGHVPARRLGPANGNPVRRRSAGRGTVVVKAQRASRLRDRSHGDRDGAQVRRRRYAREPSHDGRGLRVCAREGDLDVGRGASIEAGCRYVALGYRKLGEREDDLAEGVAPAPEVRRRRASVVDGHGSCR